jgi:hypothetical protein
MQFPTFQLTFCYIMQVMFKDVDYNIKVHIKKQLWQLVLPEITFMHPPPRKVDKKMRQRRINILYSQKRDHLHYRIMLTLMIQIHKFHSPSQQAQIGKVHVKVICLIMLTPLQLKSISHI